MRLWIILMGGGLLLGSLSGCALQSELVDLERDVTLLNDDVRQVQSDMEAFRKDGEDSSLQRRVQAVENYLSEKTSLIQKNQADSGVRVDQLATDLGLIQGKMEENNHLLSEMAQRLDEQTEQLDDLKRRMDKLEGKSAEDPSKIVLPGGEPAPDKKEEKSPPSELYNQAYRDYLQGNYDLALTGFASYLQQYPAGSLAANAQYWMGEAYYSKKDYAKSVESFEKVSIQYPKNEKVPSALLKASYAYQEMGNLDLAKNYLKRVIEQFPYSREASLAKVRLAEMKE